MYIQLVCVGHSQIHIKYQKILVLRRRSIHGVPANALQQPTDTFLHVCSAIIDAIIGA